MGRSIRLPPRATAVLLAAVLMAPALPRAGEGPGIIPMPRRPQGPPIFRVRHDALRPVEPGAVVEVRITAGPGARLTASLGRKGPPVPCPEQPGGEGRYDCLLTVPAGASGSFHVVATATGKEGRATILSSTVPVVVSAPDTWETLNALNARLAPVLFAPGSSRLDGAARAALKSNLDLLRSRPGLPLQVEGHCDPREEGDREALSLERARAVADHLAGLGVAPERFTLEGLGASEPLVETGDDQARALNRRAMILFRPPPPPAKS